MTQQRAHPRLAIAAMAATLLSPVAVLAQEPTTEQSQTRRPTRPVVMDSARARTLYVSNRPDDHPIADFDQQVRRKARTDSIYRAHARGSYDF